MWEHLFRRQEPSHRVIHKVKLQSGTRLAISECVELHQPADATVKYPASSLHVDILRRVAREGCHDVHLRPRSEIKEHVPHMRQATSDMRKMLIVNHHGENRSRSASRSRSTRQATHLYRNQIKLCFLLSSEGYAHIEPCRHRDHGETPQKSAIDEVLICRAFLASRLSGEPRLARGVVVTANVAKRPTIYYL